MEVSRRLISSAPPDALPDSKTTDAPVHTSAASATTCIGSMNRNTLDRNAAAESDSANMPVIGWMQVGSSASGSSYDVDMLHVATAPARPRRRFMASNWVGTGRVARLRLAKHECNHVRKSVQRQSWHYRLENHMRYITQ